MSERRRRELERAFKRDGIHSVVTTQRLVDLTLTALREEKYYMELGVQFAVDKGHWDPDSNWGQLKLMRIEFLGSLIEAWTEHPNEEPPKDVLVPYPIRRKEKEKGVPG